MINQIAQEVKRPALRYHGGKWLLAPWIISFFPAHETYVEPYGGAMSVLLRKPRSYAEVYNDLDSEIVNLFRQLRDNGSELKRLLLATPFSREEFRGAYSPSDNDLERARRTVIKSAMGFGSDGIKNNTGFRSYARRARYTIPAHDWANYVDTLDGLVARLRGVVIENLPAIEVMRKQDGPDTLHYVDPPYVHSTRSAKNPKQYRYEMKDDEHRELAAVIHSLQGNVILSGYDCPLYQELYGDWQREERETLADGARPRKEILWIKGTPPNPLTR